MSINLRRAIVGCGLLGHNDPVHCSICHLPRHSVFIFAPVRQWTRLPRFERGRRRFESFRGCQFYQTGRAHCRDHL